jgi:hypothetical protein
MEQVDLVKRDYKTCYTFMYDPELDKISNLKFGFKEISREDGQLDGGGHPFPVNFKISGLPAPERTEVWLRFCAPIYRAAKCLAFQTKKDAIYAKVDINRNPFMGFLDEDRENLEEIYEELEESNQYLDEDNTGRFYIRSVLLP